MNSKNSANCYLAYVLCFALDIDKVLFNLSARSRADSSVVTAFVAKNLRSLRITASTCKEMASDIPGSVALPVAPMASGQVRMAGSMPSRGGKRRSGMDFDDEDGEGPSKFSR
ncbi:PREDICTED: aryl hydrocarbon receptor nuclear translocator 2 [Tinamus guttatus]|uniref:aryl hydrocarbon receptor nuclear translocator 2 n=1 Tax=Tinamus guttatus TaxID=94827 RepID=UPI00052E9DB9|nr:PREDICTED: aryl hydrocarbon receptor nuclear translocator 2 [Tinamus guttatus]